MGLIRRVHIEVVDVGRRKCLAQFAGRDIEWFVDKKK